jgi:dTDP-4-dehydrorhamnose reductase
MLGTDLVRMLRDGGEPVDGVDRDAVDITDPRSTAGLADGFDVVVNCAAYTAVDAAEVAEAQAFAVNAVGAANVARASRASDARLVHISTDYVFDGVAQSPYAEDAPIAPRSAYGRTKAAGEWAVRAECPDRLLVRTAWLYGAHGPSFPSTIVGRVRERGGADVVGDQVGQPTWTVDLADLLTRLIAAGAPAGTYHGTSSGRASWFEFAQAAVRSAGLDPTAVRSVSSADFVRQAPRPAFSVLAHNTLESAGVAPIGDWADRWAVAAPLVLLPSSD